MTHATFHEPLQINSSNAVDIDELLVETYPAIIGTLILDHTAKKESKIASEIVATCTKTPPVKTLHNLVSHQLSIETEKAESILQTKAVEDAEEIDNQNIEIKVLHNDGLSPQIGSKAYKHRNKVDIKPTRVNPKIRMKTNSK